MISKLNVYSVVCLVSKLLFAKYCSTLNKVLTDEMICLFKQN